METNNNAKAERSFRPEIWTIKNSYYGNYCEGVARQFLSIGVDRKNEVESVFAGEKDIWIKKNEEDMRRSVDHGEYGKLVVLYDALSVGLDLVESGGRIDYRNGSSREEIIKIKDGYLAKLGELLSTESMKMLEETKDERLRIQCSVGSGEAVVAADSLFEKVKSEKMLKTLVELKDKQNTFIGKNNLDWILIPLFGEELKAWQVGEGLYKGNKEMLKGEDLRLLDETYDEYRLGTYGMKKGLKEFDALVWKKLREGRIKIKDGGLGVDWYGVKNDRELGKYQEEWDFSLGSLVSNSVERIGLNYLIAAEKTNLGSGEYFGKGGRELLKNPGMKVGRPMGPILSESSWKCWTEKKTKDEGRLRVDEVLREIQKRHHPDRGGNADLFVEKNNIVDSIKKGEYRFG